MKKLLPAIIFLFFFNLTFYAQNCAERAETVAPVLTEDARKTYQTKLLEALAAFEKNPASADSIIWLGRRTAYLGNYKDAIKIFTGGLEKFPNDARFYRHRGHRLITLRCFDDAIKDFLAAAKLVKGTQDEIEPDGLPNARNIPTTTLQTNIHYHLGLAYYMKGDFERAADAFMACYTVATNNDMRVASAHWYYMSARRLNKEKDAKEFINREIKDKAAVIENEDYLKLVRLYQGKLTAEELLKEIGTTSDTLSSTSLGYGLGNWFLYNGEKEKAQKLFRQITAGNQWASFGFIAAEAEQNLRK